MSANFIPPESNRVSAWVRYYMGRGWGVVPVVPGEIASHPRDWPGSAAGVEQIAGWWDRHPHYGVGIVTGMASDLVVLQVLEKWLLGWESLAWLEGEYGDLPDTYEVRAPDKSRHLYFRYPDLEVITADRSFGSSVSYVRRDVNILADGAMAVAPPSDYWYGSYRQISSTLEVAELPEWLVTLACRPRVSSGQALRATNSERGIV